MDLKDKTEAIQQVLIDRGHRLAGGADGSYGHATADALIAELEIDTDRSQTIDPNMRLSPHFSLREMTFSQSAVRHGIANLPGPTELTALRRLCENILEPVRVHFGRPVIVSSGYRSPELNSIVGGSSTSQHVRGQAADFEVLSVSNLEVAQWIERRLNYDQLILEFYRPGEPSSGWIHVAYSGAPHDNQELTAVRRDGRTVLLPGLVA